jgi:hypothetical protein
MLLPLVLLALWPAPYMELAVWLVPLGSGGVAVRLEAAPGVPTNNSMACCNGFAGVARCVAVGE